MELLDPAFHARADMHQPVLIVLHVTDGFDIQIQRPGPNRGGAHAEIVDDLGRYLDGAGFILSGGFLVHRDQIHAHGRFARLVALVVGIHGRHPVKWLAFTAGCCHIPLIGVAE